MYNKFVILDGKEIAAKVYQTLKVRVGELQQKNITPHLVVILIGENPASVAYVKQKKTKGEEIGCKVTVLTYEENVTTEELEQKITELNNDPKVHGILVQRPVPEHIDIAKLELLTKPEKDIDGSLEGIGENDRLAVSRMFRFVFDVVEKLAPNFQVVITEHADIGEQWYQDAVTERWRGGTKLVPDDWPRYESRESEH